LEDEPWPHEKREAPPPIADRDPIRALAQV
jgi:hypothetical protein